MIHNQDCSASDQGSDLSTDPSFIAEHNNSRTQMIQPIKLTYQGHYGVYLDIGQCHGAAIDLMVLSFKWNNYIHYIWEQQQLSDKLNDLRISLWSFSIYYFNFLCCALFSSIVNVDLSAFNKYTSKHFYTFELQFTSKSAVSLCLSTMK